MMNAQIRDSIGRRPEAVTRHRASVTEQVVAAAEHVARRPALPLPKPMPFLGLGDGRPITPGKANKVFPVHPSIVGGSSNATGRPGADQFRFFVDSQRVLAGVSQTIVVTAAPEGVR